MVGPPLADAEAQWKNREDLYRYIHNPANYIETAGDNRIHELHREYGLVMPAFPQLSNADIDSIFQYIKSEKDKAN